VSPPGTKASSARTHVVRRGDTLSALAKRYGVSVYELRRANGLSEGETLKTGESIRIPG
jgi:LysM repeat protein